MLEVPRLLREYAKELVQEYRTFLEQREWLDPETGGPRVEVIEPLILPYDGPRWRELPEDLAKATYRAAKAGASHEVLGNPAAALAWYRVGQYRWRGPKRYGQKHDIINLSSIADAQLVAAVCADRVGNRERARRFYEWAAENRTPTEEEVAQYTRHRQWDVLWETMPDAAYALACQGYLERDRRRVRSVFGTGYTPVVLNPVVLALARYKVHPTEENRLAAARMLRLQAVASRNELSFLWAVFYVLNLRARHPELVEERRVQVAAPGRMREFEHPAAVTALAISPGGERLAVGLSSGEVWVWAVGAEARPERVAAHPNAVRSLAFSPDGGLLASGANRGQGTREPTLRLWRVSPAPGLLRDLRGHEDNVTGVVFSPEGERLYSASQDGGLRGWEVERGVTVWEEKVEDMVYGLALSADGRLLAAGAGLFHGRVYLWDLGRGRRRVLESHAERVCTEGEEPYPEHDVTSVAFSGDGRWLVAGAMDGQVLVFPARPGRRARSVEEHGYAPVQVVTMGETLAVSAGMEARVVGWYLEEGEPVWVWERGLPEEARALAACPARGLLAVGCKDGRVVLYEMGEAPG